MKASIDRSFLLEHNDLEIYCIPSAVDSALCEQLIECIDKHSVPSAVAGRSRMVQSEVRKSSTCRLEEWPEYVASIKALQGIILDVTQIPVRHSEPLQGQRYKIGEYYQRHTDFYTPKTAAYDSFTVNGGQRTWTTMVYLNDVIDGGATLFPTIDLAIMPTRGTILSWNNMNHLGKENFYSIHEALPPVSNSKYVVTQWFRQNFYR